jgi:branched-subunit amino acid transport protein
MDNLFLLVIGMGLVTFIPRLIPMIWLNDLKLNRFWQLFFEYLPYAMLSALVFPSVFFACGTTSLSIIGLVVAIILSLQNRNSMVVVIGSVAIVYGMSYII